MAESKIEWTHFTFNPWRGCTKVSDGCKFCYAETVGARNRKVLGIWGKNGTRPTAAESYWRQPVMWNEYARDGVCPLCKGTGLLNKADKTPCSNCDRGSIEPYRSRVFCGSLMDIFEGDDTMPESAHEAVREARIRLFQLIDATPQLDWLLLTKRPEQVRHVMNSISEGTYGEVWNLFHLPNVWLGTSVEDQKTADERIPLLLETPAAVRFLSVEPLLGEVDVEDYLGDRYWWCISCDREESSMEHNGECEKCGDTLKQYGGIDWAIVGGESGPNARPMHPEWVRSIRDQCQAAGVPFFFKQWGEWLPADHTHYWTAVVDGNNEKVLTTDHRTIVKPYIEHFHFDSDKPTGKTMYRVGKKKAGRILDGRTWDEFPEAK